MRKNSMFDNVNRYYVSRDHIAGGEFGMGRDYDCLQWLEQAKEWANLDENYGIVEELDKMKKEFEQKVLDYISEFWAIEFKKTRADKKISKSNLKDYNNEIKGE